MKIKRYVETFDGHRVYLPLRRNQTEDAKNVELSIRIADSFFHCDIFLLSTNRERYKKTPDAIIDGNQWEYKQPQSGSDSSIENAFRKAKKQADRLVLDYQIIELAYPLEERLRIIMAQFDRSPEIIELLIVTSKECILISRQDSDVGGEL